MNRQREHIHRPGRNGFKQISLPPDDSKLKDCRWQFLRYSMCLKTVVMRTLALLAVLTASLRIVQAQIVINAGDHFTQPGQYYKAYEYVSTTGAGYSLPFGYLGHAGGGNFWDFSVGPAPITARYDYLSTSNTVYKVSFPTATLAERRTEEGHLANDQWKFLEIVTGIGQRLYGSKASDLFEVLGSGTDLIKFDTPIIEFPETIRYLDTWRADTSFPLDLGFDNTDPDDPDAGGGTSSVGFHVRYTSTMTVDAFGTVLLPGNLKFGDALRVNEVVQWNLLLDGTSFGTFFDRNFYWLQKGRGIVAQVGSSSGDLFGSSVPPSNDFTLASAVKRMFETNHGVAVETPPAPTGITGLKVTVGVGQTLINWNALSSPSTYELQSTSNLGDTAAWQTLTTTTNRFFLDTSGTGPARMKFYRVKTLP